jgi:hypothetical protein
MDAARGLFNIIFEEIFFHSEALVGITIGETVVN